MSHIDRGGALVSFTFGITQMRTNTELADVLASVPVSEIHGTVTVDKGLRDDCVRALRSTGTVVEPVAIPTPAPAKPAAPRAPRAKTTAKKK